MKRSTKRLVVLALAMALVFTLVACGKKDDPAQKETNEENAEETHTISGVVNRLDDCLVLLDDAGDYHIFDFGEDVDQTSLEEGDNVTVTYTGTLDSDDPVPVATVIDKTAG